MKKDLRQDQILNVKVNSTSKEEVLNIIGDKIKKKEKFIIFTPNPEIIMAAHSDPELASILNTSDISVPDGVGLKLAIPGLTIIKGRELMIDLFKFSDSKKLKVFLLGASIEVNRKSVEKVKKLYPLVKVKGASGPWLDKKANLVSENDEETEKQVIKDINQFEPHFLFVAFGTPKEQKWIAKHKEELKVNCIMEVGGSLNYFSGASNLLPVFITDLNLEWLWRLLHEPTRIRRIFNALILFPFMVLKEKLLA